MKLRITTVLFLLLLVSPMAFADFSEIWSNGSGAFRNGMRLHGLAISADGQSIYTIDDKNLREWNSNTGEGKECSTLNFPGQGPFISTDGRFIIYSEQQTLKFIEMKTDKVFYEKKIEQDEASYVWSNGSDCIIGTMRGDLWKGKVGIDDSWVKHVEDRFPGVVNHISFDGGKRFSATGGQEVRVYDKSLKMEWKENQKGSGLYKALFIEGAGKQLLVGIGFTKVTIYNALTGATDSVLPATQGVTGAVSNGSQVALAFNNKRMAIYSFAEGTLDKNDWKTKSSLYNLVWTPDNRIIGFDLAGQWWIWDLQGTVLGEPQESKGKVISLAYGTTGGNRWIAVSRELGITVYSSKDGVEFPTGEMYDKPALKLRALSNGKLMAIYYNMDIAIIDVVNGRELDRYKLGIRPVDAVLNSSGKPMFLGIDRKIYVVTEKGEDGKACETITLQLPKQKFWAFDEEGENVICENSRHQVSILKLEGNLFSQLGSHGSEGQVASALRDISIFKRVVATLGRKSVRLWSINEVKAISDEIILPYEANRIALINESKVAVGFPNGEIKVYSKDGDLVSEWSSPSPISALLGAEDNLFVGKIDSTLHFFRAN